MNCDLYYLIGVTLEFGADSLMMLLALYENRFLIRDLSLDDSESRISIELAYSSSECVIEHLPGFSYLRRTISYSLRIIQDY